MKRVKITIVGGGSVNWTPNIVKDILLTPELQGAEIVLYDIDLSAAELTGGLLKRLVRERDIDAKITVTDDQDSALLDSNYVIITISTGGLDAMAHDLSVPEKYGIYHTVGDTSGPGGWARTIRNYQVFVDLAEHMVERCPEAVVLNYTNPMTTLTDVLARHFVGPVIGLCHGLFENLRFLKKHFSLNREEEMSVQYSGFNHFFWITEIRSGERYLLEELRETLNERGFSDLIREQLKDEMGFSSHRELATELFRLTNIMPYLGDRHTCEFLAPYITDPERMKKYKLVRTTIQERREKVAKKQKEVRDVLASDGPLQGYDERSRESAAGIIAAHQTGKPFIDVGNVPNTGQMPDLPGGVIVETPVLTDRTGFTPLAQPPLPQVVAGLLEPYARVFTMTVEACEWLDKKMALQALRLDPVCSHLDTSRVMDMGNELLSAHAQWTGSLFS